MPIQDSFDTLVDRFDRAIKFGRENDVKRGNRCAMVLGMTLRLHPRKEAGETTMRDLLHEPTYAARNVAKKVLSNIFDDGNYDEAVTGPDQPFMERFYVKAKHLADHIEAKYGQPDIAGEGKKILGKQALARTTGVIYLEDFWGAGSAADHIDLWDGKKLLITGNETDSLSEIALSKKVRFWKVLK